MGSEKPVGAVDFGYLEGFAAGDATVIAEVLDLYLDEAARWAPQIDLANDGWRDLAHTIKGASRGIGAFALGDACARAEAEGPSALPAVAAALRDAVSEIEVYRAQGLS